MRTIARYGTSFGLVFVAALAGFAATYSQLSTWYASLRLPDFTPPNWLFAPVWTVLYVCMAIALARVWDSAMRDERRRWLFCFGLQLLLLMLWSFLFFTVHSLFISALDIIVLWFTVVTMTLHAYDIDRVAFWLLVPYLAWITFALILNISVWWIN